MKRRGFSLIELMAVVAMLGLFMLAASQLFVGSMHLLRSSRTVEEDTSRYAALTRLLGRDVWNAAKIEAPDARTAVLTPVEGDPITWRAPDGGGLIRSINVNGVAEETPIRPLSTPVRFAVEGPVLVVRPERESSLTITELRLPSQVVLANGGKP